jgi:NAD(P)-dependent dehydrogenase (short-subunit alcohol dehydrogenase family)
MKVILITGASSGIGKATAKLFAQKGYQVIAGMRSPEKEKELNQYTNIEIVKLDVEQKEEINDAIQKGIDRFGKIDILLNNAGYCAFGPLELASKEQIRRQYEVNVFGVMNMIQSILPHFRQRQEGMIVNISSIGGKIANPFLSLYQSSKFAIEGLSESLYYELAPYGIQVKLIEPGNIDTDFTGRSLEILQDEENHAYQSQIDKFLNFLMADRKKGNLSSPEVVAEAISTAVLDKSQKLRYLIGNDAEYLDNKRTQSTETEFLSWMRDLFQLEKV